MDPMQPSGALRPVIMKINVPFCSRACSFCDRCKFAGRDTAKLHAYALALALELKANADNFSDCEIKAIHFGGGTASILDGSDFANLVRLIRSLYHAAEDVPISMRTCPADINGANQPFFNRAHVTMYHLEMLAFDPEDFIHLDYLRYEDQLPYIAHGFLRAGAKNDMGFVLLYGKKQRSRWGFRRAVLASVRRNDVAHIILQRCTGADAMTDEECAAELAEAAELLTQAGYTEYIPLHWAKPGCEDAFAVEHAKGTEVIGFGAGAVTRFDCTESRNTFDLDKYLAHSADFLQITEEAHEIG